MVKTYRNTSRTSSTPRRPFEKERLDSEMQLIGKYGLKNKKEVWRVQITLARLRKAARELLTLDEKDPRRIFEGSALMKRMYKYGLLNETENKLDYVLGLTLHRFMDRRLQTLVYRKGLARSVHHARVLIRQRHIRLGKNLTNVPSVMVRVEQEKNIDFSARSSLGGGQPGRNKRKALKNQKKNDE